MRHYLNTALKGKSDNLGLTKYSVYFMFSVNRQTFKIKSRIMNKPYTEHEFAHINSMNNKFMAKDEEIINTCIERSINNGSGFLDIDHFKELYAKSCTSITFWLKDYIGNTPNRIMDEFMYGENEQSQLENKLINLEQKHEIDRFSVLSYLNKFNHHFGNDVNIIRHLLVYDWLNNKARQEFTSFCNKIKIPSDHSGLLDFIDDLVAII